MSNHASSSHFPPRTSSVSKANEVLSTINPMPATLAPDPQDKKNTPRSFLNKLLPNSSGSSKEKDTKSSQLKGVPYRTFPYEISSPIMGVIPQLSVEDTSQRVGTNVSSPNLLVQDLRPESRDNSGSSQHYRHSSYIPFSQRNRGEGVILSQQSISPNPKNTQLRQSQNHSNSSSSFNSSQYSLVRGSQSSSLEHTIQPSSNPQNTGQLYPSQLEQGTESHMSDTLAKQLLRRSITGVSVTSENSFRSETSKASSTKSKLKAWSSNLKNWSFGGWKTAEGKSSLDTNKSQDGKRTGWRKSSADLLSASTGNEPKSGDKDSRSFWKKQSRAKGHSPEQNSSSSGVTQTVSNNYESVNRSQYALSPTNSQPTSLYSASNTQSLQASGIGNLLTPKSSSKTSASLADGFSTGAVKKLHSATGSSCSSSLASLDSSRAESLPDLFTPLLNLPTTASPMQTINSKRDEFGFEVEVVSEEEEDETITLKAYQESLMKSSPVPMRRRESVAQSVHYQTPKESNEFDIESIFHVDMSSAGYGTLSVLLQHNLRLDLSDWTQENRELPGLRCFYEVLSYLTLGQMIKLARTSRRLHAATLQAIFEEIHFKPGACFIPRFLPHILGINDSVSRQSICVSPTMGLQTSSSDIQAEKLKRSKSILVLAQQVNQLEKMLSCGRVTNLSKEPIQETVRGNGSFIRSIVFHSNWGSDEKIWKVFIPVVEKLFKNGGIDGLKNFKWDLEIPVTSGIMMFLASQDRSLRNLSLNGFHQKMCVDGTLSRALPGPLKNCGGLVVLELQKLGLDGGTNMERDKQYMKDIFGVILRSPDLRVLRLGAGNDVDVALPMGSFEKLTTDHTSTQASDVEVRAWIDLPVFDYDTFLSVNHKIRGSIGPNNATKRSTNAISLSPFKKTYRSNSRSKIIKSKIRELSLVGFLVDPRLLNSEDFTRGSLVSLKLFRCCFLRPKEVDTKYPDNNSHCLLGPELRKNLQIVRVDEGLICSAGKADAQKIVWELFAGLPPPLAESSLKGNINRHDTVHIKRESRENPRELYILPTTYRGYCTGVVSRDSLNEMVLASMRTSTGTGGGLIANWGDDVRILALSANLKVGKADLGRLMMSNMMLGLEELAVDLQEDAWDIFLRLVPNMRNLTTLCIYSPRAKTLHNPGANALEIPSSVPVRPTVVMIKPQRKLLTTSSKGLDGELKAQNDCHIKPSLVPPAKVHRRYPLDDANDILRSVLINEPQHERDTFYGPTPGGPQQSSVSKNAQSTSTKESGKLTWISIGRAVWQVVKLEPAQKSFEKEVMEARLRRQGFTEDRVPPQGSANNDWGLKRCYAQDAHKAGAKIINFGTY